MVGKILRLTLKMTLPSEPIRRQMLRSSHVHLAFADQYWCTKTECEVRLRELSSAHQRPRDRWDRTIQSETIVRAKDITMWETVSLRLKYQYFG